MARRADARTRAVEVLRQVLERGGRAAPLAGEKGRGLSGADQDLLRELVLGVLRWRSALDAEIASVSRVALERLAPKLREILEVALYQIRHLDRVPDYAAVSEAVSQARESGGEGAAKLVNGVLRGILLLPAPAAPPADAAAGAATLARAFSHPLFLVERWLARFGPDATRQILEADNAPSPLDLLTNPRRQSRDALVEALRSEGVEAAASPVAPLGLTVTGGHPMRSRQFAEGAFLVQDVGAQLLPLLMPAGDTLVDLAAAPGGKSFASVFLGRSARALALDVSIPRLRLLEANRRRLGVPEVVPIAADVAAPPLPAGRFGRVLFDAACSGTGTLRKAPEIRYRISPAAIAHLAKAQETGLAAAVRLLAPGGYLLYATCSLEVEENEEVVGRVLEKQPEIEPASIEAPEALRGFVSGARWRRLPDAHTDGFTAHLLRRRD